ncbi:MAG TPA: hypothetical protein VMX77_02175 [Candidatus Bathyarchaeia archaeon]|nr:hypothetical protein [Candidatus Bathyarchaeia archaeon]
MGCERGEERITSLAVAKDMVRKVYLDAYRKGWRPGERSQIKVRVELATALKEFSGEVVKKLTDINGNEQSPLAQIRDGVINDIRSGAMEMELMSG